MNDDYYVSDGSGTATGRRYGWDVGFGLQAADGLTPSAYAVERADEQVRDGGDYARVEDDLRRYHADNPGQREHEEADLVACRISRILQTSSFIFQPSMLAHIHRELFAGILPDAWVGQWRTENIGKREPVLGGGSVEYAPVGIIGPSLDYDFAQEKERQWTYRGKDRAQVADEAMGFVSGIWQIHPFREGNTRTAAVFAIQYLRGLGYRIDNRPFAGHARYFRDALVLDNTFDPDLKDHAPLARFVRAALFDPTIPLRDLRAEDPDADPAPTAADYASEQPDASPSPDMRESTPWAGSDSMGID